MQPFFECYGYYKQIKQKLHYVVRGCPVLYFMGLCIPYDKGGLFCLWCCLRRHTLHNSFCGMQISFGRYIDYYHILRGRKKAAAPHKESIALHRYSVRISDCAAIPFLLFRPCIYHRHKSFDYKRNRHFVCAFDFVLRF